MGQFKKLSKYEIGYLRMGDLLEYYKQCVILNYTKEYDLDDTIDNIEEEIYDRL